MKKTSPQLKKISIFGITSRFILPALLVAPMTSSAWGGRGHHVICSTAVHLVKDKSLHTFLKSRGHMMGHLCNIPDIYWKSLPAEVSKEGNAAHFIDPEVIGLEIAKIPEDYKTLTRDFQNTENKFKKDLKIFSVPDDVGSVFWRANQFFERIAQLKEQTLTPPTDKKQEQDAQLPYNKAIFGMITNMGLMGHFVGDAGQPFHTTADYDGYQAGHGGIHSYFEEQIIAAAPADLEGKIAAAAAQLKQAKWMKADHSVVGQMKLFAEESHQDIPMILKLDPVTKKSTESHEKGLSLRTEATRVAAEIGWKKLEKYAIKDMARSALFLAQLWDQAYVAAGKPDLSKYRSFQYPLNPDYVPLDYTIKPEPQQK